MADAADLKSATYRVCGFKSRPGYHKLYNYERKGKFTMISNNIQNGDVLVTFTDLVGIVINKYLYYFNRVGYDTVDVNKKNNVLYKIKKIYRAKKPHFLIFSDEYLFRVKEFDFSNFNLIYEEKFEDFSKVKVFFGNNNSLYKTLKVSITDDYTMKDFWELVKSDKIMVTYILDILFVNPKIREFFNITEKQIRYYYSCIENDFFEFIENPFDISKN